MAETHLLQHLASFVLAMWWTKGWLMSKLVAKWRFAVSGLVGSVLWIYVAYTATKSVDTSSGVVVEFQSMPLAYFAAFMAFVSVIGILLGFVTWAEEEGKEASENVPQSVKSGISND